MATHSPLLQSPTEGMQKGMNYEENTLPEIAGDLGRRR